MLRKSTYRYLVIGALSGIVLAVVLLVARYGGSTGTPSPPRNSVNVAQRQGLEGIRSVTILLDDFKPQPYQGESVYYYNRLGGDRGAVNDSILEWGDGQATTTVSPGNTWGGVWMSLNHPLRETLPIDFSALLPAEIAPMYQSQISGISAVIRDGTLGKTLRLELKNKGTLYWKEEVILAESRQTVGFDLPPLEEINEFLWILDHAATGDAVVLERVTFTATTQITDTATAAFVWSYSQLLNNWNPATGLVRDKAKDASGEFDAIQATGSLAAATAVAEQLDVVSRADAVQIVGTISDTLLLDLPRFHGMWPHWVMVSPAGEIDIVPGTEWSSVDTVIAALGLLAAQSGLGLNTSGTEQMLQAIEWDDLVMTSGISHGYTYGGDQIPYAWNVFGGESWLVALAYAGSTGQIPPLAYPSPPTANGSGFIDELAWLFVEPPSGRDAWGIDWTAYRASAAKNQIAYYATHNPTSCLGQLGLFGLSAAEVPNLASVPQGSIYQAFGVGGRFAPENDGVALFGTPVAVPHYAATVASLQPKKAIEMWNWLIDYGHFSPLNNVESLTFSAGADCQPTVLDWNQLKGSWNLSLQTLGWGRYLAERDGQIPILWQATAANRFLNAGYDLLAPDGRESASPVGGAEVLPSTMPPVPTAAYIPQPSPAPSTTMEGDTQPSCDGEPLYAWGAPGLYRYKTTSTTGDIHYRTIRQASKKTSPGECPCGGDINGFLQAHNFGEMFDKPPTPGLRISRSNCGFYRGDISIVVVGSEQTKTSLGTFQAVRVDTTRSYRVSTMNHSDPSGSIETSEWYVCGYGLIRSTTVKKETYQGRTTQSRSSSELDSFTPISMDESHVRYILADMQLIDVVNAYRADIADKETAEALRRWNAGTRVVNIDDFEGKIVDGLWRIVHLGIDNLVVGTEIILTDDLAP